jgi:hypothetical protein
MAWARTGGERRIVVMGGRECSDGVVAYACGSA